MKDTETINGVLIVPAVLGLVLYLLAQFYKRRRLTSSMNLPPCNSGWIPFIGCAIEFGKEPLIYIEKMRQKLGPVFTLYIAGKRMTYLTDEEDYNKYFMHSEHVDFQKAVHLFVANAASVSSKSFLTYHTGTHDTVKGKLAANQLPVLNADLRKQFDRRFSELKLYGSHELNEVVRLILYPAVIRNLFGEKVLDNLLSEEAIRDLTDTFVRFDDQFEYGTQIPQIFLRDWAASKNKLLSMFKNAIHRIQPDDTTLLKSVCDMVDKEHAANYGLLMMWASLANAIPIAFWAISLILSNPEVRQRVENDIIAAQDEKGELMFTEETFRKLKYIRCCFLEAVRLRSPGVIVRMVVKPFTTKGYSVPAGDLLFVSPYWAHRNEKHFPNPEKFLPDRWLGCDFSKSEFLPGFVAFGGGRYRCPGRSYALMELHMFISMMFHKYNMTLESDLPTPNVMHLVGVQQPNSACLVNFEVKR